MNSVSWFLYFADVAPRMGNALVTISAIMFILCFCLIPFFVDFQGGSSPILKGRFLKISLPAAFILFMIALALPSRETIYLIAGSEIGETVVTSQPAQEILDDIQQIIKKKLNEMKEE